MADNYVAALTVTVRLRHPSAGSGTTTDTDTIWRLATSTPSAPSGGTSSENHTPTGWQRTQPNPTTTQGVYSATRTRTFTGGSFTSATSWGNVTLVAGPVSEAPGTPGTPTRTGRTSASLTLACTPPTTGGAPDTYRWRYSTNSTVTDGDPMVTSFGPSVIIPNLSADTNYWIDVRGENTVGNSGYSGDLATSTLASDQQPTPVEGTHYVYESNPARGRTIRGWCSPGRTPRPTFQATSPGDSSISTPSAQAGHCSTRQSSRHVQDRSKQVGGRDAASHSMKSPTRPAIICA